MKLVRLSRVTLLVDSFESTFGKGCAMNSLFKRLYHLIDQSNVFGAQKFVEKFLSPQFVSYSFYGEDVLINSIINRLKYEVGANLKLNYVDIGAWRPIRGSNTYHFYKMGSCGTVVEPSVAFRKHWKKVRPRDNYIEAACGNMEKAKLLFFEKDSPANTLSADFASNIMNKEHLTLGGSYEVKMLTLPEILEEHLRKFPGDYFLDIDVEGLDFEVISSFDFKSIKRPIIIVIEDTESPVLQSKINKLLESKNYFLVARTPISSCYLDFNRPEIASGLEIPRI